MNLLCRDFVTWISQKFAYYEIDIELKFAYYEIDIELKFAYYENDKVLVKMRINCL